MPEQYGKRNIDDPRYGTRSRVTGSSPPHTRTARLSSSRNPGSQSTRQRGTSPSQSSPVWTGASGRYDSGATRSYANYSSRSQASSKKHRLLPFVVGALLLGIVVVGTLLFFENRSFTITVNGTKHELKGEHTLASIVQDGLANPQPGNLLAVDGSLWEAGGGDVLEAVIDGAIEHDHDRRLRGGETILISNGQDAVEPFEESIEAIPYEVVEQGIGPIHVIEGEGIDGSRNVKRGKLSGLEQAEELAAPQHLVCKKYFPDTQGDKVIALTFDDGPWEKTTAQILDILEENDARATFFTVGELIDRGHGTELVKRASDAGHQICTHTYTHARGKGYSVDLSLMPPDEQVVEVEKGYEAIEKATGKKASRALRTPGGNFKPNTQKLLYPIITAEIGWTIDPADWKQPGVDSIVSGILSARSGDIVLLHDGGGHRSQTVEALQKALPLLKEQGYRFVTIDELLQYPALV